MPYNVYSKLYDSLVWSVVAYDAAIWGTHTFSCIEAVQHRTMRVFLGTIRNTPTAAMAGDMGWQSVVTKHILPVSKYWIRPSHMSNTNFNKRIFLYCLNVYGIECKNWCFKVLNHYSKIGCYNNANNSIPLSKHAFLNAVKQASLNHFLLDWETTINSATGRNIVCENKKL